jgi:hypothetical protein
MMNGTNRAGNEVPEQRDLELGLITHTNSVHVVSTRANVWAMESAQELTAEVLTYNLKAVNGRHIRKATLVRFSDGVDVKFLEPMSKRRAAEVARKWRAERPERVSPAR